MSGSVQEDRSSAGLGLEGRKLLIEKQPLVHTLINADRSSSEDRNQYACVCVCVRACMCAFFLLRIIEIPGMESRLNNLRPRDSSCACGPRAAWKGRPKKMGSSSSPFQRPGECAGWRLSGQDQGGGCPHMRGPYAGAGNSGPQPSEADIIIDPVPQWGNQGTVAN